MTVMELMAELGRCPPDMEVCVWNDAKDDYVPIVEALWEDGTTHVDLLTFPSGSVVAKDAD